MYEYFDTSDFDSDLFREGLGADITDDMIASSVQSACDFFCIDEPSIILTKPISTGVFICDASTSGDDVLNVDIQQLHDMGLSSQDALDLVLTHETAHRILQDMAHLGLSSSQEELYCDYLTGVRALLNEIDISLFEQSLENSTGDDIHPKGSMRIEALEAGVKFARSYLTDYNNAPSFNDCLSEFKKSVLFQNSTMPTLDETAEVGNQEARYHSLESMANNIDSMRYYAYQMEKAIDTEEHSKYMAKFIDALLAFGNAEFCSLNMKHDNLGERTDSVAYRQIDSNVVENQNSAFKEFSSDDIKRHISDAEARMRHAQSTMEHNAKMIKIKGSKPHEAEQSHYNDAKFEFNKAKSDLIKWKHEKPDKK